VHLNYDPLLITVQPVTAGKTLDIALQNEYDNARGTLSYSAGTFTTPLPSQNFTVATITFNAKSPPAPATTELIFNKAPPRETGVTAGPDSVLRNASNLKLDILPPALFPANTIPPPPPSSPPATPSTSPTSPPSNTPPVITLLPRINTINITGITATSATLNGSLTSPGSDKEINLSLEWGATAAYGQTTPVQIVKDLNVYSFPVNNLIPGTAYHFRMKAMGDGEVVSGDGIFTTLTATPSPPPTTTATEPPVLRPEPAEPSATILDWFSGNWVWVVIATGTVLVIALVVFLFWRNRY
jgi:hypothetical protein